MPKRYRDMEKHSPEKKKRESRFKLLEAPPINSIEDLIEIGQTIKFYKNIDTIMLWRITPYLQELNNLVGMKTLKETIFYQILYYIQGMHLRNRSEEYLHTIIMGEPGCGKCLAKNTPVLMYNGTIKMIQNIQPLDLIMGDDSTQRTVLSTCKGREIMYKIKQKYGNDYIVNKSHILSLKLSISPSIKYQSSNYSYCVSWYDKKGKHTKIFTNENGNQNETKEKAKQFLYTLPQKGSIIDISIEDYLTKKKCWKDAYKGYKVSINFNYKNVDLDPYILGHWLGINNTNNLQLTNVITYFEDLKNKINYDINLKNLEKYNLQHIPKEYIINTKNIRLELLAGILDSQEYLDINNINFNIQQKFSNDIIFLIQSLGFRAETHDIINGKYISIVGNIDEIPTKIHKKVNSKKNNKDYLMYDIKVQQLEEDHYYGFEIDGNHRFVLGDFTVTHNTTVAKIIAKIYQGMDILSKNGVFKIAHRDDFIAGYLGQTAIKTQKLLKSCLGGVLFIDEVYSLAPKKDDKDSFSKEALDILCSFLSEHPNDFCCIAAGYEKDINECFFTMNQGLKRRFPWVHKIDGYTSTDLAQIFCKKVKEMNWELDIDIKVISNIFDNNKELFKYSGGDIENFVTKCKMTHSKRVITLDKQDKFILIKTDIENALEMIKKQKHKSVDKPPHGMYI